MTAPYRGGFQCGAVRYEITAEPLRLAACHCTECQKQSGSAFGMGLWVAKDSLVVTGELKSFIRTADSGKPNTGLFCPQCGNRIYNIPGYADDVFAVKPGTLDDTSWLSPDKMIWTKSKQPWVPLPEGVPTHETQG